MPKNWCMACTWILTVFLEDEWKPRIDQEWMTSGVSQGAPGKPLSIRRWAPSKSPVTALKYYCTLNSWSQLSNIPKLECRHLKPLERQERSSILTLDGNIAPRNQPPESGQLTQWIISSFPSKMPTRVSTVMD